MELTIQNLKKSYGKYQVLKRISIHYQGSGLISIVGPSGSGKSTLLHLIGGLDEPTEGKLSVNGIPVSQLNRQELVNYRNHHVGFVFQDYFLIKHLNVMDNILLSGLMSGGKKEVLSEKAYELIRQLGLTGKETHFPNQLSGGEKQRAAIARALINNPEILLADEPTGNLDKKNSENIFQILRTVAKERLVVIVTHDLEMAKKFSDKIYPVSGGVITEEDTGTVIYDKPVKIETEFVSLNFVSSFVLAFRHLFSKRGRLVSVLVSLVLSLTCIGLLLSAKAGSEVLLNNLYQTSFNINLINVQPKTVMNKDSFLYFSPFIQDKDEEQLNSVPHVSETVMNYNGIISSISLSFNNGVYEDDNYQLFKPDEYFKSFFSKLDFIGNIPDNNQQIIISMDLAKKMNSSNPLAMLDQIVTMNDTNEQVTITGIARVPYSFYPQTSVLEILKSANYNAIGIMAVSAADYDNLYIQKLTNPYSDVTAGTRNVTLSLIDGIGPALLAGNLPSDSNEVLVSSALFSELTGETADRFLAYPNQSFYLVSPIFGNSLSVTIAGVFQSQEDTVVTGGSVIQALTKVNGTSVDVYVDNYKNIPAVTSRLNTLNLKYDTEIFNTVKSLDNSLKIMEIAFYIFITITTLISFIIIFSIVSSNAIERTNEIGILKALGAKNRNIVTLFNIEAVLISILSILLTIILTLILNPVGNYIFKAKSQMNGPLFQFSLFNIFILLLMSIFVTVIGGFIPAYRASRLNPVDALRK